MMMKRILCLLASLFLIVPALAAAEAAEPVTEKELTDLLASVRETVAAEQVLNDPADESALSEDGICFRFDTAVLYAEGTTLTPETPVNALYYEDSEGPVFRGTGIDSQWTELMAAFPLDNADLSGTREEAVLYLRDTENGGFVYGKVMRDGQRLLAAEYGEYVAADGDFRRSAVTYTLQNGMVTSIRFEGLNPKTAAVDRVHAGETRAALEELAEKTEYTAVSRSLNGLDLTAFGEADLVFGGVSYTELTPETLPGTPDTELIDNEDGTWLLRCDGDGYAAVFRCDENGKNASILSYTILDEDVEGPRGVRLGDLFSEDFCRFRNGENEMTEEMTELLYGKEGSDSWGYAEYMPSAGESCLRYVTSAANGTRVELLLKYEENTLKEIIIHNVY